MESPFTGGAATLVVSESEMEFRKEKFKYVAVCYQCVETKEYFSTPELEDFALQQVYNQYRCKYHIPYAHEIAGIRKHYGLSCAKMSEILGFGEHQLKNYEDGDMPSATNGKILANIMIHSHFLDYLKMAKNQLSDSDYKKLLHKIQSAGEYNAATPNNQIIFGNINRGEYNGFATADGKSLQNIVLYILQKKGNLNIVELNRILFALDILKYSQTAVAATGLSYQKYSFGIGVKDFAKVFSLIDGTTIDIKNKETIITQCSDINTVQLPDDLATLTDEAIKRQDIATSKEMNDCPLGELISFQKAVEVYYKTMYDN